MPKLIVDLNVQQDGQIEINSTEIDNSYVDTEVMFSVVFYEAGAAIPKPLLLSAVDAVTKESIYFPLETIDNIIHANLDSLLVWLYKKFTIPGIDTEPFQWDDNGFAFRMQPSKKVENDLIEEIRVKTKQSENTTVTDIIDVVDQDGQSVKFKVGHEHLPVVELNNKQYTGHAEFLQYLLDTYPASPLLIDGREIPAGSWVYGPMITYPNPVWSTLRMPLDAAKTDKEIQVNLIKKYEPPSIPKPLERQYAYIILQGDQSRPITFHTGENEDWLPIITFENPKSQVTETIWGIHGEGPDRTGFINWLMSNYPPADFTSPEQHWRYGTAFYMERMNPGGGEPIVIDALAVFNSLDDYENRSN